MKKIYFRYAMSFFKKGMALSLLIFLGLIARAQSPDADDYEPNNTVAEAKLLPIPPFTQNVSAINISPASCHVADDVDYYKIEVPTGASYIFSAELYDTDNNSSHYTLDVKASYSTDGSTWTTPRDRLPRAAVPAGTFYLKIESYSGTDVGTYAAKIDLIMATTAGCTYTLPTPASRTVTADAATNQQITVTATGTTCFWAAASNVNWITVTTQSGTGSGNVVYSYTGNTTTSSRTGIITIAGLAYTVTQAALSPDGYEENNSVADAKLLLLPTPPFTQNASTIINISSANCHISSDIDIYKIELPVGSSYTFSAELYDKNNQRNNSTYTLDAKISYSTDNGTTWSATADSRLPRTAVQAGTLYLKIESNSSGDIGTYSAKIDLSMATTAGCTYTLPTPASRTVTAEGATNQQITVTATGTECSWTATSDVDWITITAGQSGTGSGNVVYSYAGNTTPSSRTGIITIAGQAYTVTQEALQADGYEENNSVASAKLLPLPTPPFTQNASTIINISSANCHISSDVDYYKIELPAGGSYIFSAELYDRYDQQNRDYTLDAKMSYSTNGIAWSTPEDNRLPRMTVQGGPLYLKIEPYSSGNAGTYAAKIDLSMSATAGCTYTLPTPASRTVTAEAATNQQIAITTTATATGTACSWAATSNVNWIRLTTQSGTGSGDVIYSYDANTTPSSRTGRITIAGQAYTVTQSPLQADGYEPNNTVADAKLLPIPPFTQNVSAIDISPASCHVASDVDFYKIVLPVGVSYIFSADLYDRGNQRNNSNYTLYAKISYSTDNGNTWSATADSRLPRTATSAGTLYLKIESNSSGGIGTYSAKIDLSRATTAGCTYTLPTPASRTVTAEGATNQQITVTETGTTCFWAAASDVDWITITAGQSGTGSGNVVYFYAGNTTPSSRTGIITIAGQAYTVTQEALQADGYEENNSVASAKLLPLPTPPFTQNASTIINISSANCHISSDVDYYKIVLPAGGSYIFSAELYDRDNQQNNSAYTLDAKMSYSTNGIAWSATADSRLTRTAVPGGTLYLKIEPFSSGNAGTYAAKIDLSMATTAGCTYTLPTPASRTVTAEGATNQQIAITTTGTACSWTATSNVNWITLTTQSGTGSGNVSYSYAGNTTPTARTGIITVAGQAYTVTQSPLSPDGYEENNSVASAKLLPLPTPPFTQNASTIINISSANCHISSDVDFYKIELPAGGSYIFSAELYDRYNQQNNSAYTLDAKMSYSTDNGTTWSTTASIHLPRTVVQAGTLYLKIESNSSGDIGTYSAKIDLSIAAVAGCTYTLPTPASRTVTAEAATNQQITVTATGTTCSWTAFTNADWLWLTAGIGTGSGNVIYSYDANTTSSARTGIITIADKTYTVTQSPLPPDGYEPNNTVAEAKLLPIPPFTQNVSAIDISPASCHVASDVDFYKIELPAGGSYIFSAELYDSYSQRNRGYTLDAKMSYSTNGIAWSTPEDTRLPRTAVPGGTLYLKIEPFSSGNAGTYAAKIDLSMATTAGCTYTLPTPASRTVTAEGATNQQIAITTTGTACSWTATSNVNWITLTTQSGTGSGNVSYSYTGNTTPTARTGIITVAGQAYTVTQSPLSPDGYEPNNTKEAATSLTATFIGDASTIDISSVNCHVATDVDYYKIELPVGGSYTFSAELYDTDSNSSHHTLDVKASYLTDGSTWTTPSDRLPTAEVQGGTLYLKIEPYRAGLVGTYEARVEIKSACAYSLAASSVEVVGNGSTATVEVTAGASCPWRASSDADWITVNPAQGTGTARVSYAVARNTGAERTGKITIAGQTLTVRQAGAVCSFTLPSTPIAALSVAGEGQVSVTATATDCQWTATPNVSWITIPYGQTLVGTKNLNFSYEANPSNASREGTITIAGGTVTVTQAGAVCSYTLFPASMTVFSAAGTGKVLVTAQATISGCPWTATSNVPWITIPAGQTLAGTKDLDFSYEANSTNAPREGTITIAGQTFTVKQSSLSLSSPPATGFETASPVKIFPNPAKDFVTIEVSSSNQEWTSLKITNIFGQALYERTNPEHKMQIPLTGFSSGLYFVVLQGKEKTAVQKLIIE